MHTGIVSRWRTSADSTIFIAIILPFQYDGSSLFQLVEVIVNGVFGDPHAFRYIGDAALQMECALLFQQATSASRSALRIRAGGLENTSRQALKMLSRSERSSEIETIRLPAASVKFSSTWRICPMTVTS